MGKRKQTSIKLEDNNKLPKTNEEVSLEDTLFGSSLSTTTLVGDNVNTWADEDDLKFTEDVTGEGNIITQVSGSVWQDEDDEDLLIDLDQTNRLKKLKTDELDSVVSGAHLSNLLQERFQPKTYAWAVPLNDEDKEDNILDDDDLQLLNTAGSMVQHRAKDKHSPLLPGPISIKRLLDVNSSQENQRITSINFHPKKSNLMLVSSADRYVRVYKIDEEKNDVVLDIKFTDIVPLQCKFLIGTGTKNGDEIIITGRKPYYYIYDCNQGKLLKYSIPLVSNVNKKFQSNFKSSIKTLETLFISPQSSRYAFLGNEGYIHFVNAYTKQWVGEIKMNSHSRALTFLNEDYVLSSSFDATIYLWNLNYPTNSNKIPLKNSFNPKCIYKFQHEDGTPTSLLNSYVPSHFYNNEHINGTYNYNKSDEFYRLHQCLVSVSSMSGVTSIYELQTPSGMNEKFSFTDNDEAPKTLKNIMNLTTKITTSSFHPSGQILAIASNEKKDQLKLIHLPSCSVFTNWPVQTTPLNVIEQVEFSPNGQYLAIGNTRGRVLLFRINHFVEKKSNL